MSEFNQDLKSLANKVDRYLKDFFQNQSVDSKLYEAMKYGLFPGGKMLRSYLVHATSNIFNLKEEHGLGKFSKSYKVTTWRRPQISSH